MKASSPPVEVGSRSIGSGASPLGSLGYDRHLQISIVQDRTHSLFRQGAKLDKLIPNMPEPWLRPLIQQFVEMLLAQSIFSKAFSVI